MCGFVGITATSPIAQRAWLAAGRDTMLHRGPDDAGEWWSADGRVGLGHRRLSILDLSPLGHQPMEDAANGLCLVFNGEIYNHEALRRELTVRGYSFRSNSDTEVLLAAYAAWGEAFLTRLNGMFSFALYDGRKQRLYLARDRAGEKPLFFHLTEGKLLFSSELKGLLANPAAERRIDPESLDCYLGMGFIPGDRCILRGYRKLPPAHALRFDLNSGACSIWRYWSLPEPMAETSQERIVEQDLLVELERLLESAVGLQLVADVPVGVLLSGGVDSSLITAMAARQSDRVHTFTIGFPGHGKLDETDHARLIARYFGTEHTELMAGPTTVELLPTLARQFDEPMVDSSMIPTWLVTNLVGQHCKVALGGDGGDELFGGYPHYCRLLWLQQRIGHLPLPVRRLLTRVAERWLPMGMKGRNYLQSLGADLAHDLPLQIAGMFDAFSRGRLMRHHPGFPLVAEKIHSSRVDPVLDLIERATRMDYHGYLAEDLLVKVDRTSMLNSLEVRAPLLDCRLIEFAFSKVPPFLKATAGGKKILLKRLAARLLPPEFDLQRKQGFSIPLAEWLREGSFRELFRDVLASSDCLFDRMTTEQIFWLHDRGFDNGERLFTLVQFELWRHHYRARL